MTIDALLCLTPPPPPPPFQLPQNSNKLLTDGPTDRPTGGRIDRRKEGTDLAVFQYEHAARHRVLVVDVPEALVLRGLRTRGEDELGDVVGVQLRRGLREPGRQVRVPHARHAYRTYSIKSIIVRRWP